MLPVKNNLGNDRLGFEYRVTETLLNYSSGPIKAPFIEWLGVSNRSAGEILNPPKPKAPPALDIAKDFLRQELSSGPKPMKEVQVSAEAVGISKATLNRAKEVAGVISQKTSDGWTWSLMGSAGHE
jgi:hypothetical protein